MTTDEQSPATGRLMLLAALAGIPCLLGWTASWWWVGECALSWSGHCGLFALAAALLLTWYRFRLLAAIIGLIALASLGRPLFGPVAEWTDEPAELSVLAINRAHFNPVPDVDDRIAASNADVIFVAEALDPTVSALRQHYPYLDTEITGGAFGHIFASRFPATFEHAGVPGNRVVVATVTTPTGPWRFVAAHPPPPLRAGAWRFRNVLLTTIGVHAHDSDIPTVLLGDWNCTPQSPAFNRLTDASGCARPYRLTPGTWPRPFHHFGIGIDHVLIKHAAFCSWERFDPPGSDHMGVLAGLRGNH